MRLAISTLTFFVLACGAAQAVERPTVVTLTDQSKVQQFKGVSTTGESKSYIVKTSGTRKVTFHIEADNETCGAELRTDAELGFMPEFRQFPTTRVEEAEAGETFRISLFQTRAARLKGTPCNFLLSIE
ncbi:hypothetical protein SAMN05880590_110142 [Rhizobium sp. RU35A]|uniref:hypothetical protein n=1 Tax=Rhizobium sp. RU35A TaxID=1907414 RepID=UPI00095453E2|nr:hypothetical protein [Rhizobium sp. RU35A]SIR01690.1 hypothetical protein SAMN05880590_110142 [Rhizobium sp. RU35A]